MELPFDIVASTTTIEPSSPIMLAKYQSQLFLLGYGTSGSQVPSSSKHHSGSLTPMSLITGLHRRSKWSIS